MSPCPSSSFRWLLHATNLLASATAPVLPLHLAGVPFWHSNNACSQPELVDTTIDQRLKCFELTAAPRLCFKVSALPVQWQNQDMIVG